MIHLHLFRPSSALSKPGVACLVAYLVVLGTTRAERESTPARAENVKRVEALLAKRQARANEADHLFVRRGLVADRTTRTVMLDAEATGLKARDIVEFPIIAESSGHDYEALLMAFAKPSEIVAALEFIGVPRGRPATPEALALWPKGERVRVSVEFPDGQRRPIEELILDVRNDSQPLPVLGFIHAGSTWTVRDGQPHCAADDVGPGSVASSYNESTTVLDMPRLAQQGEVYERFVANPSALLEKDAFVTLWISPEPRPVDHPKRVMDLTLVVTSPEGAMEIAAARFTLLGAGQGADSATGQPLADVLRTLRAFLPDRDPYVTLDLGDSLSVRAATDLASVLAVLDNEDGMRIEPPKAGQLYYKAFAPRAEWRDRAQRVTQPCELRFARGTDGKPTATLVRIEEIWSENPDNLRPDLKVHEQPIADPGALPAALVATKVELPVLLVFASGDMTLGALRPYLRAVQTTHPNVHVFAEP
jgi:hypothetical protein